MGNPSAKGILGGGFAEVDWYCDSIVYYHKNNLSKVSLVRARFFLVSVTVGMATSCVDTGQKALHTVHATQKLLQLLAKQGHNLVRN